MYETFFNLTTKPFELVPNPDFLFLSKSHKRALTYLDYGIRERAGFILLTGEVGSGKTTVLRDLIKKHHDRVVLSKVFNTRVNSEQLIAMINDDFGLSLQGKDKIAMLRDLNDFLIEQYTRGMQPVIIIDEAQNLAPELLEEVRMLSNLETDNAKLLQIILAGQPELRKTLDSPGLLQLRQRISINCHIQPLTRVETEQYILHRLEKAGDRDAVMFSTEALDVVFKYSRGIPRLINIICDFLMLSAFAEESKELSATMVKDVVGDLDFEKQFWETSSETAEFEATVVPVTVEYLQKEEPFDSLLKDACRRCDSLERETSQVSKTLVEMVNRMNSLQQSLTSHLQENDAFNAELKSKMVQARLFQTTGSLREIDRTRKDSFWRRMLGV